VDPPEVLAFLVELCREAGLQVRSVGAQGELPARSGVCRVRDGVFVILVASDPVEDRIAALAQALREHRPAALEGRYLPPAVRERLE
jgi:ribosomal protein L7Ae-like RNA K-turn-binding protein